MFSKHRENIAKELRIWFNHVKENTPNTNLYPIEVSTVLASAGNPVNIASNSKLPAIFFQYGRSRPNPSIKRPNTHFGETLDYAIFAVINSIKDNEGNITEGLLTRSAKMQSLIQMFVEGNQRIGNSNSNPSERTREVRLGQSRGYGFRKMSDRGFIEFHIEIDHIYPIMRT